MAHALEVETGAPLNWSCRAWAQLLAGDNRAALNSLERAEACRAGHGDAGWAEHGLLWRALRASAMFALAERKAAADLAEATLGEAVAQGPAEAVGRCELVLGNFKKIHGNSKEAEQHFAAAKRIFEDLGDGRQWVLAELNALICVFNRGDYMEVVKRAMALTQHPEVRRNPHLRAVAEGHLGNAHARLGAHEESLKHRHESLRLSQTIPGSPGVAVGCLNMAHTHNVLGNHAQARAFLGKLFRLPPDRLEPGILTAGRVLEATVALSSGDAAGARALADAVDPGADPHCRVQTRVDHAALRTRLFAAEHRPGEAVAVGLEGCRLAVDSGNEQKLIELLECVGDVMCEFPAAVPEAAEKVRTALDEWIEDAADEVAGLTTRVYAAAAGRAAQANDRTAARLRRKLAQALAAEGRHAEACAEFERSLEETEAETRRSDARSRALLELRFEAGLSRIENEHMVRENEALQREVERRRETEAELRRIDGEKNALLRVVAHDLRSPAAAIRSIVDILEDPETEPSSRAEWLGEIRHTSEGMMDLVANLLDLERLRSGDSGGPVLETVDLAGILGDVARAGTPHAMRKEITLETVPPAVAVSVLADAKGLRQCARNLVSNALKFSPPGSRVRLCVEPADDGAGAALLVEDEGPGVAPGDVPKLFIPFTCLSAQPTAGESTSGIGLSIVKRLMERMGGEVFHRHREGGGAVFGLRLPKA